MAKRRTESATGTYPHLEPSIAINLLSKQLEAGEVLAGHPVIPDGEFTQWRNTTIEFIKRAFGSDSANVASFSKAEVPVVGVLNADQRYYDARRRDSLNGKTAILKSCIDQLKPFARQPGDPQTDRAFNDHIFLVHGRNEGIREMAARFLESLGLPVTILHERPNRGQTIIEKFEEYSDVGFAVVLLTGDDRGGLADQAPSRTARVPART